jgi:5-methylcytosine-specific restriction endonuclease McrBC regulatory subunit McrC
MRAAEIRSIGLTRLTQRYENAKALAALLVASQELSFEGTGWSGGTILFSMARVWERFVERWVRARWSGYRVVGQAPFHVGDDGTLPAAADVLVYQGSTPVALYDAKYKFTAPAPSRADVYQMVTYCERLGLSEATLVYPERTEPRSVRVSNKTIRVLGILPDRQLLGSVFAHTDPGPGTAAVR